MARVSRGRVLHVPEVRAYAQSTAECLHPGPEGRDLGAIRLTILLAVTREDNGTAHCQDTAARLRTTSAARLSATAFDDDAGTSVGRYPPRDAGPVPDHRGRRRERPVSDPSDRMSRRFGGGRPRLSASSRTRSSFSGVPGSRTGPWGASWKGGRLVVRARARDTRGLATPIELLLELGRREAR
ncbi:hypothetical protein SSRG_03037 [Streptomyces griseoflavus Tu4000]|uniref:Uncharacterized protein n=1 Tax=Streptomyces griseoflavus Tu4000 TaxID=467200 RepID=D9XL37_9ACTN|nr:hypothetical protein SSRG_03037 [Streptomyces griseoflavus Tu4000]